MNRSRPDSNTLLGAVALAILAAMALAMLSGCAHLSRAAVTRWATEKTVRWAECQSADPASREQAEACLGEFARDLGTDACAAVSSELEKLP